MRINWQETIDEIGKIQCMNCKIKELADNLGYKKTKRKDGVQRLLLLGRCQKCNRKISKFISKQDLIALSNAVKYQKEDKYP